MSKSLLIEFLAEEMPSDEQVSATEQLAKNIKEALDSTQITYGEVAHFSTPRRIAVLFAEVAEESQGTDEEIKGPKKSAPPQAIEGFLKKYNLSEKDCEVKDHNGELTYFYINRKSAEKTAKLLPSIICKALYQQHWKNSMRFGNQEFTWIRPLRNILVMLGDEVIQGSLDLGNGEKLAFGTGTFGHSRLHPELLKLANADDYEKALQEKSVIADAEKRKEMIVAELNKQTLQWQENDRLLQEVNGLVEYPYFAIGTIDKDFLKLPAEVLGTAMIKHQKYFPLFDGEKAADKFAFVANIPASDEVIKGNERVVRARLQDAVFLFEEDKKIPLKDRVEDLKNINHFEGLGTMYDKTERLKKLAEYVAECFGIVEKKAVATALLLKADLTTEMVGEFPELQGIMGSEYAKLQSYDDDTIQAIRNHYKTDDLASLSQAMSLIDKVDHLTGAWKVGKKPTGSKDPFALRRAALGIVKIIAENIHEIDSKDGSLSKISLKKLFNKACEIHDCREEMDSLIVFCCERYKVLLAEEKKPYDILDAVFDTPKKYNDIFTFRAKVEALENFLPTGSDTVVAIQRIISILKAENIFDVIEKPSPINESLLEESAENNLWEAYQQAFPDEKIKLVPDPAEQLKKLANLVKPINNFFDNVMVNVPKENIRQNRLNLLKHIANEADFNGDFSKLVDR